MDMFRSKEQEHAWKLLNRTVRQLRTAADDLLDNIRQRYPELDLSELNRAAWTEYVTLRKEMAMQVDLSNSGSAPSRKQAKNKE
jgi:hypothetical protein